jgi:hypothetical protein
MKKIKQTMDKLSIGARTQLLNEYKNYLDKDAKKAAMWKEINPLHAEKAQRAISSMRKKYIGDTSVTEGSTKININSSGDMRINGKAVQIDRDSGFVKLGGGGKASSSGAFYSPTHFDGQLQGSTYIGMARTLQEGLQQGSSIKDTLSKLTGNSSNKTTNKEDIAAFVKHLGLTKFKK